MSTELKIALAQIQFSVGDVGGNMEKMIATAKDAVHSKIDLCVFPELALSGYPPEDMLFQPDFKSAILDAFKKIVAATKDLIGVHLLFGFPHYSGDNIYNAAAVICEGHVHSIYHKQKLPNYGVFDEKRYFIEGQESAVIKIKDFNIGLLICEDIWQTGPVEKLASQSVDFAIIINASPFSFVKHPCRLSLLKLSAESLQIPFIYLNNNNAQDDLIFDGGACYVNEKGDLIWQGEFFKEALYTLQLEKQYDRVSFSTQEKNVTLPSAEELMYSALVQGVRDYVNKNKIPGVVIGLSGGLDSALTLTIAVDALGASRVHAVFLPSRYSADISGIDAKQLAENMNVEFTKISIEPIYTEFLKTLKPVLTEHLSDTTEENLQARARGALLMAVANQFHYIVLNTSNKSEVAMGYSTLYGDSIGGYAVLKDVLKTWVYRLANYRNKRSPVIPQRIIDRPPSAELAPNQTDQDTLPPYPILDEIIERYEEQQQSEEAIIEAGFDAKLVKDIIHKINVNEYKRRQFPPGPKVTERAFSRERRWPITERFLSYTGL